MPSIFTRAELLTGSLAPQARGRQGIYMQYRLTKRALATAVALLLGPVALSHAASYYYKVPAPKLVATGTPLEVLTPSPTPTQAPTPTPEPVSAPSPVGDGSSTSGACASGAATNCATWGSPFNATLSTGLHSVLLNNGTMSSTVGTIAKSSGKWYWELTYDATSLGVSPALGVVASSVTFTDAWPRYTTSLWIDYVPQGAICSVRWGTYSANTAWNLQKGDVVGIALDMDAHTLNWYRNGTLAGTLCGNLPSSVAPFAGYGNTAANWIRIDANFGQTNFRYPVPAGYNAGLF